MQLCAKRFLAGLVIIRFDPPSEIDLKLISGIDWPDSSNYIRKLQGSSFNFSTLAHLGCRQAIDFKVVPGYNMCVNQMHQTEREREIDKDDKANVHDSDLEDLTIIYGIAKTLISKMCQNMIQTRQKMMTWKVKAKTYD